MLQLSPQVSRASQTPTSLSLLVIKLSRISLSSRPSTPCRPCLPCPPATSCCSSTSVPCPKRDPCKPPDPCARSCCEGSRLGGGGCCSQPPPGCCPSPSIKSNCCPPPSCPPPCDPGLRPSCPPPGCCPPPCSPPPCQPCAPQPRPILKKRSCCLCAPGGCMCQPMPRNCSCPPPIQIDARADDECTCDCPSSPECACPPSERRFSRTRTRCQNARICCPLPRLPPGPPCCCTECRPCLPPPCDPCSSSRCCSPSPRFKFCRPASPCPPCSPCRPQTPARPCRPSPACSPCRKPSGQSPCRSVARSSSRGSSCCSPCRAPPPGQSSASCCDHNDDLETAGCGCGDDRESEFVDDDTRSPQCRCGPDGKGCADDCDWCCSQNCAAVDPGNGDQRDDEGRVLEPNQPIASAEKLTAVDSQSQVDTPTTAQGQPTPTISAVKAPGTLDHGSRNGRTALPGGTRRPAINTLHSRLAERRLSARRRSGIGGHVPNAAGAAVEPKSD